MNFQRYKLFARKVFPNLPEEFEGMSDELKTYQFVFNFTCPAVPIDTSDWTDLQKHDLHSISNMTETQIRNIFLTGKSIWNNK